MLDPRVDAGLALASLAASLWEGRRARAGRREAARWSWLYLALAVGFGAFAAQPLLR